MMDAKVLGKISDCMNKEGVSEENETLRKNMNKEKKKTGAFISVS